MSLPSALPSSQLLRSVATALALTFAAALWLAPPATAATASSWVETDHSAVRLVSAVDGVGNAETVLLGLHIRLQPGWKTYWRSPGDAGYPPRPDWSGSDNLASVTTAWPAPERFSVAGLDTIGYRDEVVLPLTVALARPGEALTARADVDYMICDEICIPFTAAVSLRVPPGPATPSEFSHLIDRFANNVPRDGARHGLTLTALTPVDTAGTDALRLTVNADWPLENPDVFIEGPPSFVFDRPSVRVEPAATTAELTVPVTRIDDDAPDLPSLALRVTLVDGARSAEQQMVVGTAAVTSAAEAGEAAGGVSILPILAIAVLGGLILNLMPCVLPVLSLKVLSVVGHGGGAPRAVRISFLASSAGIIVSFLLLAAILAGLKAAGGAVGWGIQFQQPWFLTAMVVILVLFACNLWGLFDFRLPQAVAAADARAAETPGLWAPFLTGAFATLLATPCSAPFVGTAVGFALSRSTGEILAVFLALGIGLALPYLLIAAFPAVATRLPRPGKWMVVLRRVLALALVATAVWLLTVLAAQMGLSPALALAGIGVAIAAVFVVAQRRPNIAGWRWPLTAAAVAGAFLIPGAVPIAGPAEPPAAHAEREAGPWGAFDPGRIPALVADGRTVYVNVTADWCITCKVNERAVLASEAIESRLGAEGVVAMRGDWTRPDDRITRFLSQYGRYGIPFDAVYGPGSPEGQVLPELLTPSLVIDALERAQVPQS